MLEDEVRTGVVIAEASTKAFSRSILIGSIPIIEFGALIVMTILIAQLPLKIMERLRNG